MEWSSKNQEYQVFVIIFSCAYFAIDFFYCYKYGLMDINLVLHHSMVISAYLTCILKGYGNVEGLSK